MRTRTPWTAATHAVVLAATLALVQPAGAAHAADPDEVPAPRPAAIYARPAPIEPTSADLRPVGTTSYRITSIAAASETTIWLAGIDAQHRVVVQKVTKGRGATARPQLHPPTTLRATAPNGVQISAVDEAEAWLVTAPDPQTTVFAAGRSPQTATELWRSRGTSWARVAVALPGGPAATAWEVRDTPGTNTALVNTMEQVWRYNGRGFTNASTDIYRSDWSDSPTGFDYGIRPTADGFLAIGLTPMQVNYLRGRGGVVSLVSTVGGWALGSQSSPTAWRVLRDGSTLILGEQREYDSTQDIVTFGCAVYSATDTATTCPAPKGRVTGALGVGASTVLLATSDGLWRRPRPTAQDERVSGELGRGVEAMDAARGSRVAWVATRAGAGEGSVLSRYVAR
ncbi:MAG: hypothetical protein M9891_03600 [Austwickia sp.]|nr:hypothetical protein [Austwickia sp.]MCO5308373.1 hypothetical protein [Austwickia sp.]